MSSILRFLIRIGETCISQESRFYLPALSYLHRLNGLFAPMSAAVKIAEPTGIALDVGANLGMFSYELRRSFPKVVAFEPNGELSACLRALKDEQITLNNFSLSSKTGTTTLHVPVVGSTAYNGWATLDADSPSLAEFKDTGAELKPLTVEMFRLDDLDFSNDKISFIKVDVEGHEVEFLDGAQKTLETHRPVVFIEVNKSNRQAVSAIAKDLAYGCQYSKNGCLVEIEDLSTAPDEVYDFTLAPN